MERLCDMDISTINIKDGDIKVDSEELKILFKFLQVYHSILCNSLDALSENEKHDLEQGLEFTEYMQNKYLILGKWRNEQRQWFNLLKKLDNEDFIKGYEASTIEEMKRDVWGFYIEAKGNRERLQKEVDEKRKNLCLM